MILPTEPDTASAALARLHGQEVDNLASECFLNPGTRRLGLDQLCKSQRKGGFKRPFPDTRTVYPFVLQRRRNSPGEARLFNNLNPFAFPFPPHTPNH